MSKNSKKFESTLSFLKEAWRQIWLFASKLSYADVMSTLSIIFSAMTYVQALQSDSPDLTVTAENTKTELRCNRGAGKWEVVALVPFRIESQTITALTEIGQKKKPNPVLAKQVGQPRRFPVEATLIVPWSVNQVPHDADPLEMEKFFIEGENSEHAFVNSATQPGELSVEIPPEKGTIQANVPADFTLGFISDMKQGSARIRRFTLTFEFTFGNGENISKNVNIETPPDRGRVCP